MPVDSAGQQFEASKLQVLQEPETQVTCHHRHTPRVRVSRYCTVCPLKIMIYKEHEIRAGRRGLTTLACLRWRSPGLLDSPWKHLESNWAVAAPEDTSGSHSDLTVEAPLLVGGWTETAPSSPTSTAPGLDSPLPRNVHPAWQPTLRSRPP